jgi:POT family proton-dependent oligopeptide transporter
LLVVTLGFFGWMYSSSAWTPDERKRLYVIGVLFLAAALFWSVFEQAGSTLNLFADRNTDNTFFGRPFPSSWFQSMNSLFLIIFAPIMAWLWVRMSAARKEPSSPMKFAVGLLFVGVGFVILIPPAQASGQLASPMWLTVTYFFHTIGELCLSPVGLSAMTVLAPPRIGGLMMGIWFLATSVGNFIGGRVAGLYESFALPSLFGAVGGFAIAAGVILMIAAPAMRKLMPAQTSKAA